MEKKCYYKSNLMGFERISEEEFNSIQMNWIETSVTLNEEGDEIKAFVKDTLLGMFLNKDSDLVNKIANNWFEWWQHQVYNCGFDAE